MNPHMEPLTWAAIVGAAVKKAAVTAMVIATTAILAGLVRLWSLPHAVEDISSKVEQVQEDVTDIRDGQVELRERTARIEGVLETKEGESTE